MRVDQVEQALFRDAVAALDAGDVDMLRGLVDQHPELALKRVDGTPEWLRAEVGAAADDFFSRPYLIWFIAEDPIRKGTLPPNTLELLQLLISAANQPNNVFFQEQLDSTLRLVSWSGVAADAGLQVPMIAALVDAGAAPGGNATNALVNGHEAAASYLLSRGDSATLAAALCLDLLDDVETLHECANPAERQFALVLCALRGKAAAVEWLLSRGSSPNEPSAHLYAHGTPLHHAVCSSSLDTVRALVNAGADPTCRDALWHGTAADWAEHYIENTTDARRGNYVEIARYLHHLT